MSPIYINGVEQVVAHKTKHQTGGADEVSIAALVGSPAQKAAASGLASLSAGSLVVQKPADRLSKANFEWTVDKLLKGAGAGADPTEIDPGATTFAALTDVKLVRKTADEIVNNSTVLQNDNELLLAIAANEVWEVTLMALAISATTAPDLKCTLVAPVAATGTIIYTGVDLAGTPTITVGIALGGLAYAGLFATQTLVLLKAIIVNGANAGNLQFQWAQNVATVEDTTVKANSCLIAHKLA